MTPLYTIYGCQYSSTFSMASILRGVDPKARAGSCAETARPRDGPTQGKTGAKIPGAVPNQVQCTRSKSTGICEDGPRNTAARREIEAVLSVEGGNWVSWGWIGTGAAGRARLGAHTGLRGASATNRAPSSRSGENDGGFQSVDGAPRKAPHLCFAQHE